MMKKVITCIWVLCMGSGALHATTISDTLYLNFGQALMVDSSLQNACAFNPSPQFSLENKVLLTREGDSLQLTVFNSDTMDHTFFLEDHGLAAWNLPAGQFSSRTFITAASGAFLYEEGSTDPAYRYLGAGGMLVVENTNPAASFYWNIREFQSSWNDSLQNQQSVSWASYKPDYFMLNGKGKPQIKNDSSAVVRGGVGDTIRIYVINTGLSLHSLHFHGYHVRVVGASHHAERADWIKDTVPVESKESLVLELIPDKPGMYPVHDHNLIAVSGGGYYPNGIFLVMDIN